jgi:hypothetical protein
MNVEKTKSKNLARDHFRLLFYRNRMINSLSKSIHYGYQIPVFLSIPYETDSVVCLADFEAAIVCIIYKFIRL